MPFCTLLEWDHDFDLENYYAMVERSGSHAKLPEGCLGRVVGPVGSGARVIEIWSSAEDARRFGEASSPLLKEFAMPAPSRTAAFETSIYEVRK